MRVALGILRAFLVGACATDLHDFLQQSGCLPLAVPVQGTLLQLVRRYKVDTSLVPPHLNTL